MLKVADAMVHTNGFMTAPTAETIENIKFGWIPDLPDFRDYTIDHPEVRPALESLGLQSLSNVGHRGLKAAVGIPAQIDLRPWCSKVEDQGPLGSCTANAGAGVVEYFEKRAFGKYLDASRLFLYKVTRDLLGWTGDTGAYLRSTMGALVLFGIPPEIYEPYDTSRFDEEPSAFCYSLAHNYQIKKYFRLDPAGITRPDLLAQIKTFIAAGIPSMFGFTVYSSYTQANTSGKIPFPVSGERVMGGHAIVAVGYDDNLKIKNTGPGATETTGAFLIRNSWGTKWGDAGYGWLPYEYVLKGVAVDWWCVLKQEWIDTGQFGIAAIPAISSARAHN